MGEGLEAVGVHDDNHTQNTDHFTALEQAIPVRETTTADISLSEISNRSSAYLSIPPSLSLSLSISRTYDTRCQYARCE